MNLENPISFISEKTTSYFKLKYENLMEIGQGGPEVGNLFINDIKVKNYLFGGPFLSNDEFIYLPVYIKNLFIFKGFRIAQVNIKTLEIKVFGNFESLISLFKIEGDYIYYYKDLDGLKYEKTSVKKG